MKKGLAFTVDLQQPGEEPPPSVAFTLERMKAGDDWVMAHINLLNSDVPLHRTSRSFIALMLALLNVPEGNRRKGAANDVFAQFYRERKHQLVSQGFSKTRAHELIAEEHEMLPETLRKRLQPSRLKRG